MKPCKCGGWMTVYKTRTLKNKKLARRYTHCKLCKKTGSYLDDAPPPRAKSRKIVPTVGTSLDNPTNQERKTLSSNQLKSDNSFMQTPRGKTMQQSELDLELLAVRVVNDKKYFLSIEDCTERYGCTFSQWLRWSRIGLVPEPFTIADETRWGVQQLEAWEKDQGIEMLDLHKQDQADTNKLNAGSAWTSEPITKI